MSSGCSPTSPAEAVHQFRRAIAGTGPTSDDPRVPLARAMFALGGVADADALLRELRESGGKTLPRTCDLVAELLIEQGDLEGALDWATAGIDACMRGDDRGELQLLLRLRYRIRGDLGLPEDDYDKMLAQGEPSSSVGYLPGAGHSKGVPPSGPSSICLGISQETGRNRGNSRSPT